MYQPQFPPFNPDVAALTSYTVNEFQRVAQAESDPVDFVQLNVLNAEPARMRDGMLIEADGTNFDPGSGAGTYMRRAGAWVKLG
jgi:hypothetical protein